MPFFNDQNKVHKHMCVHNNMYWLIFICLISLGFVHGYKSFITQTNKRVECDDVMNKRLFSIQFDVCIWNILHIVSFFVLCFLLKPTTVKTYILIFILGVVWFCIERAFSTMTRETKCAHEIVYSNITVPRYDDMVYNGIGILIYALYICYTNH